MMLDIVSCRTSSVRLVFDETFRVLGYMILLFYDPTILPSLRAQPVNPGV